MVTIIAAMDSNGVIGYKNALPWHLPSDLKRFKAITTGGAVIMGRVTYESIGGSLPNRVNIVISRDRSLRIAGCTVVDTLDKAIDAAGDLEKFVIGGAEIYDLAMDTADKMILTQINTEGMGDTYFPFIDDSKWGMISSTFLTDDCLDCTIHTYTRAKEE